MIGIHAALLSAGSMSLDAVSIGLIILRGKNASILSIYTNFSPCHFSLNSIVQ